MYLLQFINGREVNKNNTGWAILNIFAQRSMKIITFVCDITQIMHFLLGTLLDMSPFQWYHQLILHNKNKNEKKMDSSFKVCC